MVDRIDGCFYNVVGFPAADFAKAFGKMLETMAAKEESSVKRSKPLVDV